MPWKPIGKSDVRRAFVEACWKQKTSVAEACRCFGISRQCGHKWLRRAQEEGWSTKVQLADRSHRTRAAERLQQRWGSRVLALRRRHPYAGADQLRWYLELQYPLGPWPGVRTITDWLQGAGLTRPRRRRALPGPQIERLRSVALRPNDVWTIDFKGWFYTRDRQRVLALTVRDGATGFLLLVRDMKGATDRHVRKVLIKLFRRYGLPRVMRSDNGPPFGGEGPRGWSSLAVWLVGLGVEVEYGRPGCPGDNAAHEQMHQVLKRETTKPAAPTRAAQQRRFDRWRNKSNHHRPHKTRNASTRLPLSAESRSDTTAALVVPGRLRAETHGPTWTNPLAQSATSDRTSLRPADRCAQTQEPKLRRGFLAPIC